MRNTWDSSNAAATASLSWRALARSWPNGFSKTTRVQAAPPRSSAAEATRRALRSPSTIGANSAGGTAR